MQYTLLVNQSKALEWGLNSQQAMLFSFVHQVPTWASSVQADGLTWFNLGKGKIVEELPLLTGKQDTAYRLLRQLSDAGVIAMCSMNNKTYIRLTEKGLEWNKSGENRGSEKNPRAGKKSEQGRKKIRTGSDKSPTNHITNDQITSINKPIGPSRHGDTPAKQAADDAFELFWLAGMRKANKKKARAAFDTALKAAGQSATPKAFAESLAADVKRRIAAEQMGFDKMHPTTYLNGERWEDDLPAKQLQPGRQDGRKGFAQPMEVGAYTPTDMDNLPDWMRD